MRPTVDAYRAGETVSYWSHVFSPLDVLGAYEMVLDGLIAAKADRYAALVRHDHAKVAGLAQEIVDLTFLAGEFAEGFALARQRHFASGRAWPLSSRVW